MPANGSGPPDGRTVPVAIVGMDVMLPGSGSLDHYWRNLVDGVDAITEAPDHRVERRFLDPDKADNPNRIYCYRGGFVDEFAEFDPMAYGVMPASIPATEPEQLIALKVAAGAIEDAGGIGRLPDREKVGVILGRLGQSGIAHMKFYARVRLSDQICTLLRQLLPGVAEDKFDEIHHRINASLGPYQPEGVIGLMPNLTASRVANRLDLRGPAYTLDAACASSLIALDHGIAELSRGRLDMVLCGGVHHNHDVAFWSVFTQIRALSREQRIRPFDLKADGLLIGEGTGIVAIKRLSDALRDGDRIHAVIRGIGTSSDGRAASLVNPETAGQIVAVRRAWQAAGLDPLAPDALGLLEAHGTGTPVGDVAEIATMTDVFGPPQEHFSPVIGSVKSMIGHTMPAAGAAGLIKATLAVERGMLLPTLHCDEPRPELARSRFRPLAQAQPWPDGVPRRAAVNAFGFGGINAHVIIEQAPDAPKPRRAAAPPARPAVTAAAPSPRPARPAARLPVTAQARVDEPDQLVLLAAPDTAALARLLAAGDHEIRAHGSAAAASTVAGAGHGPRLAVVDPTTERLSAARKVVGAGGAWRGGRDVWFSPRPMLTGGAGRIAFVFPGLEAELSNTMDDVIGHFGLTAGGPVDAGEADFSARFVETMRLGWLLHDALGHIGIAPDAVAGHSLGEWTAGLIAGLVDESMLGDYAALLFNPAFQRQDLHHAVAGTNADTLGPELVRYPGVHVSLDNAPAQCVVCGPAEQVERLIDELSQQNVLCRPLPFATGMHTPYMEPYLEGLRPLVAVQPVGKPRLEVWSSAMAAPVPTGETEQRELFYRQLVEPVRFRAMVAAMHEAGIRAFLQVGPGQLASLIQDNLRGQDHLAIPVNVEFRSGLAQLRRVAAALWTEGHAPCLAALDPAARGTFGPAAAPAQPAADGPAAEAASAAVAGDPGGARAPDQAAAPATAPGGEPADQPAAAGRPKPAGKLAVMLDLGSPPINMGEDPGNLLSSDVVSVKTALARGIPTASDTAVGKLTAFAGRSPASVELAALLEDTASAAVAVLAATGAQASTRPAGARPAGPRVPAPNGPGRPPQPGPAPARPAQPPAPQPPAAQPSRRPGATGPGNGHGEPAAGQHRPNPHPAGGDAETGYKFVLRISIAELPYVLDHVFFPQPDDWPYVGDRMPVVPACTMIQFMIDAVRSVVPDQQVVDVSDARFSRWMLCEPPSEVELTVKPAGPGVFSVTLGAFVRAMMRTEPQFLPDPPEIWQPERQAPEWPTPLSVERMYADRVLFHGPRYRGVEKVHALGDRHIRGTLRVPAPPGGLLDAGLQIIGNWVDVTLPTKFVVFPTGFESIRFFGPAPAAGERVEFVGRFPSVDDRVVMAEFQVIASGRVWAQATGASHQRFDSHPRARPTELAPGRNSFADPQPEGWVQIFDYWPYPESTNSCSALTMGTAGYLEVQQMRIADRKPWLLSRLAVKDAVRYLIWDDDGTREIFPIELRVTSDTHGYARVREWPERKIPPFEASFAHAGQGAVAIARPAGPGVAQGVPGIGIGMVEIHDDPKRAEKAAVALSGRDTAVLDGACAAEPGTAREVWASRLLAAKEAAAKAEGIAPAEAAGALHVTAATASDITVAATDRSYRLHHRQISNPAGMATRSYVVAWTRGPEPGRSA
jgi:acyl transferase domain-containing protein